jgi:hypothetical protein
MLSKLKVVIVTLALVVPLMAVPNGPCVTGDSTPVKDSASGNAGHLSRLVGEAAAMQAPMRQSRPGEIGSGREIKNVQGREIVVNTRPCRPEGDLVVFRWPFRRTEIGSVNCGGAAVRIVQVEQL